MKRSESVCSNPLSGSGGDLLEEKKQKPLTGSMRVRSEYRKSMKGMTGRRSAKLEMSVQESEIKASYKRVTDYKSAMDWMIVGVLNGDTKLVGVRAEGKGDIDTLRAALGEQAADAQVALLRSHSGGLLKTVYLCYLGINDARNTTTSSIFSNNATLLIAARSKVKPLLGGIALSWEVEDLEQLTHNKLREKLYVLRSSQVLMLRVYCKELDKLIRVHFDKDATLAELWAQCGESFGPALGNPRELSLHTQAFDVVANTLTITPLSGDTTKLIDLISSGVKIYVSGRGEGESESAPRTFHYDDDRTVFEELERERALELRRTINDAQEGKRYNVMIEAKGEVQMEPRPPAPAHTHTHTHTQVEEGKCREEDEEQHGGDTLLNSERPAEWWYV
jgi:hypothetical protein